MDKQIEKMPVKGFDTVSTRDGKYRIWVPEPRNNGTMKCACSFGIAKHMELADAISELDYLTLIQAVNKDNLYSELEISVIKYPYDECWRRFIEDLQPIMENYFSGLVE